MTSGRRDAQQLGLVEHPSTSRTRGYTREVVFALIVIMCWLSVMSSQKSMKPTLAAIAKTGGWESAGGSLNETTTDSQPSILKETGVSGVSLQNNHTSSSSSGQRRIQDAVVDILSIGTRVRPDQIEAQRQSMAKHVSVRHFVVTTEDDDWDQGCHNNNMTYEEDIKAIVHFCKITKRYSEDNALRLEQRGSYANYVWLGRKANPVGWMCAIPRPFVALYNHLKQCKDDLPDYLVILDDDSYYEMEGLLQYLDKMDYTPDKPLALAGCRVRAPFHIVNFTFPFGGFGLVQSKASLQLYLRPIYRDNPPTAPRDQQLIEFDENARNRLETSLLDEGPVFREGMTLIELIKALLTSQPYSEHRNWTTGFCFHSDWTLGYFANFYNIGSHVADPAYVDRPEARIESFRESEIYGPKTARLKACNFNTPEKCKVDSVVCHYQTPESMSRLYKSAKAVFPGRYRD